MAVQGEAGGGGPHGVVLVPVEVLVVLFYPADTVNGGVGGFWWLPATAREAAWAEYRRYVADFGSDSVVRLLDEVMVPEGLDRSEVTEYVDGLIDELETRREVLAEHRPPGAEEAPEAFVRVSGVQIDGARIGGAR